MVLRSFVRSFVHEVRLFLGALVEPSLLLSLLVGLVLWSLAYQTPFATVLHIGGDSVSHRREDDAPFLRGFNGSQPDIRGQEWWTLEPGYGYRWTSTDAQVRLPGLGGGLWAVALTASSGRADGSSTSAEVRVGDRQISLTVAPQQRTYRFLLPADALGDLALRIQTPRYLPPNNDPRELGFVLSRVEIAPAGPLLRLPALGQFGWLALALTLIYLTSRRVGLPLRGAFALALGCAVGLALLLLAQRLVLTVWTHTLVAVLAGCYGLAVVGAWGWARRGAQLAVPLRWSPLPLVVLAFALRVGGLFHPHTRVNDIGLHANNLLGLSLGSLFFTEGLPSDAGGGQSPYPPGVYLVLLPWQLLMQTGMDQRIWLLSIGVALLDSVVVALLWFILWRAGAGARAATFGAALYLAPPPLLASFSIGEAANIGGQALALAALVALWDGLPQRRRGTEGFEGENAGPLGALVAALCVGLLAHMGVAISLVCTLAALWLLVALQARWRPLLVRLTVVGLLAGLAVAACYYSAPLFVAIFAERLPGGGASGGAGGGSGWLRLLGRLWVLFEPGHRITPLLTVAGLVGAGVLWQRPRSRWAAALATSWWLGVVLSLGLLLVAQQGVREQHFLYPALCLGAGPLLASWWQRGPVGRITALAALLTPIIFGALFWVEQLVEYLH